MQLCAALCNSDRAKHYCPKWCHHIEKETKLSAILLRKNITPSLDNTICIQKIQTNNFSYFNVPWLSTVLLPLPSLMVTFVKIAISIKMRPFLGIDYVV